MISGTTWTTFCLYNSPWLYFPLCVFSFFSSFFVGKKPYVSKTIWQKCFSKKSFKINHFPKVFVKLKLRNERSKLAASVSLKMRNERSEWAASEKSKLRNERSEWATSERSKLRNERNEWAASVSLKVRNERSEWDV